MPITGWRGDGAERSIKPSSGQPDLLAQGNRFAVARPADVGGLPAVWAAELVGVADVADGVVQRRVDVADCLVHVSVIIIAGTARLASNRQPTSP